LTHEAPPCFQDLFAITELILITCILPAPGKLMKIRRAFIGLLKNRAADNAVLMTAKLSFYI
jgi:hypothetical protein